MRQINCILPLRVCISGSPENLDKEELSTSIVEAVSARLRFSYRQLIAQYGDTIPHASFHMPEIEFPASIFPETKANLQAVVRNAIGAAITGHASSQPGTRFILAGYQVPSGTAKSFRPGYQAASRAAKSNQPWTITYRKKFQIRLRDYSDLVASWKDVRSRKPRNEELEALYANLMDDVVSATAWIVTARQAVDIDLLTEQLTKYVENLPENGGKFISWAWNVADEGRLDLANAAKSSALADLPSLYLNPGGRYPDGSLFLLPRGKLLFIFLNLPSMEREILVDLLDEINVQVLVRDVTPWINIPQFREFFHISWTDYVQEFGDRTTSLTILPFTTSRRVSAEALRYLLRQKVVDEILAEDQAVFGHLQLLNAETVRSLPAAARSAFEREWDPVTWSKIPSERLNGDWERDWFGAYIYTIVGPSSEEREATLYRPGARKAADKVIEFLKARETTYHWPFRFLDYLLGQFRTNAYRRRETPGVLFDYLLKELQQRDGGRWFNELFDAIEGAHNGDLYFFVMQICQQTSFASHPRVERNRALFNLRRRDYLKNEYDAVNKAIILDKNPSLRMKPGEFLKALSREEKRIIPARLAQLQEAVDRLSKERIGKLLRGEDKSTYNKDEFAKQVLGDASKEINLSNDDLEEITIQRWLKLIDIKFQMEDGLERYYITYEYWDRIDKEEITFVQGSRKTVSDSDFEFLLWSWDFARDAAFWDTAIKVVSVVAIIAIAWEIGAIAFLVELAGGGLAVGISIGLSELIYLCTAKHYSLEGFLIAAVEGYFFALGFRFGGGVGNLLAERIGAQSLEKLILGWVVDKITTGVVGGATSAFLIKFSNDIIDISLGRKQGFSSLGDYVRSMEIGAAMGVLFEFGSAPLQPILRGLGRQGAETVESILQKVRAEGIGLRTWNGLVKDALSKLSSRFSEILDKTALKDVPEAFGTKISQISQAYLDRLASDIAARVLRIRRINLSPRATRGMEKLLQAIGGQIEDQELFALLNRLQSNPAQLRQLLEACEALDEAALKALSDPAELNRFADSFAPKQLPPPPRPKPPAVHPDSPKPDAKETTEQGDKTASSDTTDPKDQPGQKSESEQKPAPAKTEPPKYKAMDDILTADRQSFLDSKLDAAYKEYRAKKIKAGETPAVPEDWARRVTTGEPRQALERELGPDYARQGGTTTYIKLDDIPRPNGLSEQRLQQALTRLRSRLSKVFERLRNLKDQGVVDGGVNSGHFNIAKGNVAEVLSEEIQDIVLAEIRKIHSDAELIVGVKVRLWDGANLSDAKLFTDNLIGVFRGDSLEIYGKFEVKSGPRGGAEATTQVFEWVEGRLTRGSQVLIPGRDPFVWRGDIARPHSVTGLANAKAYIITPQGAELFGSESAMQTARQHGRYALPFTASELDYITRVAIETLLSP